MGEEIVSIIRSTAGADDDFGNPTYSSVTISIPGVLVAPGASSEPGDVSRSPVDSAMVLYFPSGTVVQPGDMFVVRGIQWESDGEPAVWPVIDGFTTGVVVHVRARRG